MKYRVWEEGTHEYDGMQKEYVMDSYDGWRRAAVEYAEDRHAKGDWEASWPIKYHVRERGEKYPYSETGPVFTVEVEREMVPSFYTSHKKPEATPPGPHDHRTTNGDDVCMCAHPYAYAGDCDRCVCKSGRHYFQADDGVKCLWFVAADAAAARALVLASELELEDDEGNAFRASASPEKVDAILTFEEIDQDVAKHTTVTPTDGRSEIKLIDAQLGEWFATDY